MKISDISIKRISACPSGYSSATLDKKDLLNWFQFKNISKHLEIRFNLIDT